MSDNDLDLTAVYRDDRLLDALAARRPVDEEQAADPVTQLLAALAADVDARPIPDTPRTGDHPSPLAEDPERLARRWRARQRLALAPRAALAAGVTGVVVFASGVAAAVTGDPLAPLTPIRTVIITVVEQVTPATAKREAAGRALQDAGAALSRGDRRAAADLINEASRHLDQLDEPPSDLQAKAAQLQQLLAQQGQSAQAGVAGVPSVVPTPTGETGLATAGSTEPTPDPSAAAAQPTTTGTGEQAPGSSTGSSPDPTQTPPTATDPPSPPTPPTGTGSPTPSGTDPGGGSVQGAGSGGAAGGAAGNTAAERAAPVRPAAPPARAAGAAAAENAPDKPAPPARAPDPAPDPAVPEPEQQRPLPEELVRDVVAVASDLLPKAVTPEPPTR